MFWSPNVFMFLSLVVLAVPCLAEEKSPRPELPGGIYDKPYIRRVGNGTAIGGYIDHEFEWAEGKNSTFDQHRFIPFIYAAITDRLHVSAEIEFEHGGLISGGGGTDGEIKLEYAVMDFSLHEAFAFRGGVILSPLGVFNLLHDSPLNDLTERPTVSRQLIPSTLSESGMGFFGTFYPSDLSVATYEIYLVNGFNDGVIDGSGRLRIRGGRGSQKQDNNNNKALVGRFGISPRLGLNLGASLHTGAYDNAGDHRLTILATDAKFTRGPFEIQGEYARAFANHATGATAAETQQGAYAQTNLHFGHDALLKGSIFTGVARWDWVDYDTDQTGDSETGLTLGLNFRPVEDAVFKLDYNFTWATPSGGTRGPASGRFFFSVSTYF
ncbi:MAG: hypothetical protein O2954_02120 [bacterium]|nr:hypothetical protein [bacterium]